MAAKIQITNAKCAYEAEPLKAAFGFKGSALTGLWQTVVCLESDRHTAIGNGVQSVLWSDAAVYRQYGEDEGNRKMFAVTEYAVELCRGAVFSTPFELIDRLFPHVYSYARTITGTEELRATFVLNALVPVDLAAWQLWLLENEAAGFDAISPLDGQRQSLLANIPLITYHTALDEIREMAENGTAVFKIKLGADPNHDNDLNAMLAWDKARLLQIHNTLQSFQTPYTESGRILYYLDANGRYDSKERLACLLDFAKAHGILERIILLEEPFAESNKIDVSDLPVCIAADESAHTVDDVQERFRLGYKALTLKPIAKTLSMTIRMADYARKQGMVCFCADLTVNPVMVSWNQNVAARLHAIPGMRIGVLESNGAQNYNNWPAMCTFHPCGKANFTACENGLFVLDESFYESSGGILRISEHYRKLVKGDVP